MPHSNFRLRKPGWFRHRRFTFPIPHAAFSLRSFTLIELMGAVAVIALLAASLVPALIRQMDRIAGEQESIALKSFGDALKQSIKRNAYIPSDADWASTVATESGVAVANVSTNGRKQPRFFLIGPAWQIGTNVAGQAYTQTSAGSVSQPVSPRVMLVSSIGRVLPA